MMILLRIYPFKMCQMTKRIIKNERMVFKVKKHYTDEKTGISYTLHGDVYLPDLVYSEHKYPPLGKYGMLRQTYLKENHKLLYCRMLMNDTLWPHLLEVDQQAHDMMDTIVERMK